MSIDLTTIGRNPYESYAASLPQQGTFLKFNKGEYLAGQDSHEVPLGTRMVANMAGLQVGWVKWWDEKPAESRTTLLIDQKPLELRSALGDEDKDLWETDRDGKPRDPWQFTNTIDFVDEDGERFIFSTSSKGGIGAIGKLCREYGKLMRQNPGMVPIIELSRDHYIHKEYGKTYTPVFKIVGWADEDTLEAVSDDTDDEDEEQEQAKLAPPAPPAQKAAAQKSETRKARF
jgi:hypothetical protein